MLVFAYYFQKPFDICVPVFAFLTGLFFYQSKKTWKYAARKIYSIMINYWIVYAGLVLIAIIGCSYRFELKSFLLELFGIYRPIMYFCWYVPFYVISILLLTLIEQICRKNTFFWAFYGIVIPYIGGIILAKFVNIKLASRIFLDVSTYFPFMGIGYIVAKIDAFGYMNKIIKNLLLLSNSIIFVKFQ